MSALKKLTLLCNLLSNDFVDVSLQQREGRHPGRTDPDAGRVRRDPAAGRHTIPQRSRQWRPPRLGVHATAASSRVGRRSEKRGSRGRPGMRL